jgi:exosortase K
MKTRLVVVGTALLIAWALKRHYAEARADDLWWVLTPTARLAGVITGAAFEMQPGEGYLSRERMFLIEKSCAGVNFIIAAFGMLTVALLHRVSSLLSAVRVLGAILAAGYASAVMVNAVRISIGMWLAAHPVATPALSAADAHRIEGILVYFGGLVLLYELTRRFDRRALGGGAT